MADSVVTCVDGTECKRYLPGHRQEAAQGRRRGAGGHRRDAADPGGGRTGGGQARLLLQQIVGRTAITRAKSRLKKCLYKYRKQFKCHFYTLTKIQNPGPTEDGPAPQLFMH